MWGLGSGGSTTAGCGCVVMPCSSANGSYSWVSSQFTIPLPPHHRPRSLTAAFAAAAASCVEPARSSPQLMVYSLRQTLHVQSACHQTRGYASQVLDGSEDPAISRSQARGAVCLKATRVPQAAPQAIVGEGQEPLMTQPSPGDVDVVVDLRLDLPLSSQQPDQDCVQQGPLLPLGASIPPLDLTTPPVVKSPATGASHPSLQRGPSKVPANATWPQPRSDDPSPPAQLHGAARSPPQTPQTGSVGQGSSDRPPAVQKRPWDSRLAPVEAPLEPRGIREPSRPLVDVAGAAWYTAAQAQRGSSSCQNQQEPRQQQAQGARRKQEEQGGGGQRARHGAPSMRQSVAELAASTSSRRDMRADDDLFHVILKSTHWRQILVLLQHHQEQYMEELRRAKAAAAATALGTPTASTASQGQAQAQEPIQRGSQARLLDNPWDPDFSWELQPVATAVKANRQHQQRQQQGQGQQQQQMLQLPPPPQPLPQFAFRARHLAAALHATAHLVPEPGALGPSDRLQLGDFLRAIGHGCATLGPSGAFTPADLNMALRALARLLGAVSPPAAAADGAAPPAGALQAYGSNNAGGAAAAPGEEFGGAHFAGPRPRWEDQEHDVDEHHDDIGASWQEGLLQEVGRGKEQGPYVEESRPDSGMALGGRQRPPSDRGVHAAWLDEQWMDGLLAPTIERHLQDFEPRHVSGVLWALATLGVRPRAEVLGALCDRAAHLARASLRAAATSTPDSLASITPAAASAVASAALPSGLGPSPAAGPRDRSTVPIKTPQGLSLTLWGMAKLGFQARQSTLDALLAACEVDMRAAAAATTQATAQPTPSSITAASGVEERVAGVGSVAPVVAQSAAAPCCSLDLAQRAWALATLGCHPGAEWLDLLVRALLARGAADQVSGQSCSMVMWALAKLHSREPARAGNAAAAAVAGRGAEDEEAADWELLLRARAESNASASTSGRGGGNTAAANTVPVEYLAAAPRLAPDLPDSDAELAAWLVSVTADADAPAASAVRATGAAVGGPGAADARGTRTGAALVRYAALPPDEVAPLMALLRDALDRMSSQHLATVLWALSVLDVRPSHAWLEAFLTAAARRMSLALSNSPSQPFGPQSLAMLLAALGRLRFRPPWPWMMHYLEVCRKELPRFSPHAACTLVWALARLSYQPPGHWVSAFTAATQPLLPAMPPSSLCVMLWAVARWRVTPSFAWVHAAVAASAGQLRSGAEVWEREATALEARAAAAAAVVAGGRKAPQGSRGPRSLPYSLDQDEAVCLELQPGWELQPGLLACMVWGVSRMNQQWRAPAWWLSLAGAATQSLLRRSRAAGLASAPAVGSTARWVPGASAAAPSPAEAAKGKAGLCGGNDGATIIPTAADAGVALEPELDPRTLVMLLWGWARLRGPLTEECLYDALSYIADTAEATVASRAATGGGNPALRRSVATVAPQHIALGLWSCVVMGLVPPQALLDRLVHLHSQLLLLEGEDGSEITASETKPAAAAAINAGAGASPAPRLDGCALPGCGIGASALLMTSIATEAGNTRTAISMASDDEPSVAVARQQHMLQQRKVERLAGRQAEMGMLVWSLAKCEAPNAPGWFPGVLAIVGTALERDAAAAAALADAAVGPGPEISAVAESGGEQPVQARRTPPSQPPAPSPQATLQQQQQPVHASVSLLTVATLARACLWWRLYPGDRWVAAATTCLDAGLLGTSLRRMYGKVNLEAKVRYLLEELRVMQEGDGNNHGAASRRHQDGGAATAAGGAAEASGGIMLTNAMAAMAAGSAAAWMQGLVW